MGDEFVRKFRRGVGAVEGLDYLFHLLTEVVTRYCLIALSAASCSNLGITTTVPPSR